MSLPVEKRMIGDWQLEHCIGKGSYSEVWRVIHLRSRQYAAVKVIDTEKLTPAVAKCVESELTLLEKADHPNIVAFYEKIDMPTALCIVMEYCKDGDLESIMSKGLSDETFTRNCMAQLASGLQELRSMGLIHRDLKPANLLMSNGILKIADFGFARNLQHTRLADTLCGSPLYMAPEVLQLKKYDARADLWSAGVIMYEMLVGRTPFEGQTYIHLLKNIETAKLRLPKTMLRTISQDCLDLMVRLLQRDPAKRIDFECFFKHPFLTQEEETASKTPAHMASSSTKSEISPPVLASVSGQNSVTALDLIYSSDDDVVVIYRHNDPSKYALDESLDNSNDVLRTSKALEEYLLRVSDSINDLGEARAQGSLEHDAFHLCTVSMQILHYLSTKGRSNLELDVKMDDTIQKAERYSSEMENAENALHHSINIYGIIFDHALAYGKGGAGCELAGQYKDSHHLYSKSIDLLDFLVNKGYGVSLTDPLELPQYEIERIGLILSKLRKRQARCKLNCQL